MRIALPKNLASCVQVIFPFLGKLAAVDKLSVHGNNSTKHLALVQFLDAAVL